MLAEVRPEEGDGRMEENGTGIVIRDGRVALRRIRSEGAGRGGMVTEGMVSEVLEEERLLNLVVGSTLDEALVCMFCCRVTCRNGNIRN